MNVNVVYFVRAILLNFVLFNEGKLQYVFMFRMGNSACCNIKSLGAQVRALLNLFAKVTTIFDMNVIKRYFIYY